MDDLAKRAEGIGFYVHIPFCKRKCNYCAFLSSTEFDDELLSRYTNKVIEEIRHYKRMIKERIPKYVYIGGGTPNVLPILHLERIVREIRGGAEEISIELNPGIGDGQYLKTLFKLGITRVSIGVQSFDDNLLKVLGRIHSSEDAENFIHQVKEVGFDNFNLDLIYGLPNQTWDGIMHDIKTAISLNPTHISTYMLSIDPGTLFYHNKELLASQALNEEELKKAYYMVEEELSAVGYKRYEISNYARPGYECKYNLNTWKNGEYIGVGLGAGSHFAGERFSNIKILEKYLSDAIPDFRENVYKLSPITDFEAAIISGLRLKSGVNIGHYLSLLPSNYVEELSDKLKDLEVDGLIERRGDIVKMNSERTLLLDLAIRKILE